jgi:succinyl-CoA synthetase beta subunit
MISGQREFLCGVTHEDVFGHCVAFGVGGIFTEAMADIAYRVAPVNISEAEEMMDSIRARALLDEYRGMPPADRAALAHILSTLSALPYIHEEIAEIDINPIIISKGRPVAVDALIILK